MRRWLLLGAALTLAACERQSSVTTEPARPAEPAQSAAPADPAPPLTPDASVNPPAEIQTYVCKDGRTILAAYPDRQTAILTLNGHAYTLKIARSASGARYAGMGWQWWTKGLDEGQLAPLKDGEDVASAAGVTCRTVVAETPVTPTNAQGAANVVQTYFALLEQKRTKEAARHRTDGQAPDLSTYAEYHAEVGAPGRMEGAAGSSYVDVPIRVYGKKTDGSPFQQSGKAVVRRVNDVPGATADQLRWRIERLELQP